MDIFYSMRYTLYAMRTEKYIVGNWKMNGSRDMAWKLGLDLHQFLAAEAGAAKMIVCPPFPYLALMADFLERAGSNLALGGQDCHYNAASGAFTGDVSAEMLCDLGCEYVIVGHSERRQYHKESDDLIGQKALAAQKSMLTPILCIGETQAQKQTGSTNAVLSEQLGGCLIGGIDASKLIVAYEPVWAIGTGLNAASADIESAHSHIRQELKSILGAPGESISILYGGSVKSSNAAEILSADGVDGVLVGGASLKTDEFTAIYRAGGSRLAPG